MKRLHITSSVCQKIPEIIIGTNNLSEKLGTPIRMCEALSDVMIMYTLISHASTMLTIKSKCNF